MSALRLACGHFFAEAQLEQRPNCFVCSRPIEVVAKLCDVCAGENGDHKPSCRLSEPCPACDDHHQDHGMCLL